MKAVAYNVKPFEKEPLSKANHKKHDITLIFNALNIGTAKYAEGKDAVIVVADDDLSAPVINALADLGVRYITTRSAEIDHIDCAVAGKRGMKIANVPAYKQESLTEESVSEMASQIIMNLDKWEAKKCAGDTCVCTVPCRSEKAVKKEINKRSTSC